MQNVAQKKYSYRYDSDGNYDSPSGKEYNGGMSYRDFGCHSYQEYLNSTLWSAIRAQQFVMFPKCCICSEDAEQVHHYDYSQPVMAGRCYELLFSVCRKCHERIELRDDGTKRKRRECQSFLWDCLVQSKKEGLVVRLVNGIDKLERDFNIKIGLPEPMSKLASKKAKQDRWRNMQPSERERILKARKQCKKKGR